MDPNNDQGKGGKGKGKKDPPVASTSAEPPTVGDDPAPENVGPGITMDKLKEALATLRDAGLSNIPNISGEPIQLPAGMRFQNFSQMEGGDGVDTRSISSGEKFHDFPMDHWRALLQRSGSSLFRKGLPMLLPLVSDQNALLEKLGEKPMTFAQSRDAPLPAGGHGTLFGPDGDSPARDMSQNFAFEQTLQNAFSVSKTGEPLGDLEYRLSKRLDQDKYCDQHLSGPMAGLAHVFKDLREIATDASKPTAEVKLAAMAEAFSQDRLEKLVAKISMAESEGECEVQSFSKQQVVPCPQLLADNDPRGIADGNKIKTVTTLLNNKRFSGGPKSDIDSLEYFRDMRQFLEGNYNPTGAYLVLKATTEGNARSMICTYEQLRAGFEFTWNNATSFFITHSDPDSAERKILDMRHERPVDIKEYVMRLLELCNTASFSQSPELRPPYIIKKFRQEMETMLGTFYPYCYKSIYARESKLRNRWMNCRKQLIARGKNPDLNQVGYHPLLTLQKIVVDGVGSLTALTPDKPIRAAKVHEAQLYGHSDVPGMDPHMDHGNFAQYLMENDIPEHSVPFGVETDDAEPTPDEVFAMVRGDPPKPRFADRPTGAGPRPGFPARPAGRGFPPKKPESTTEPRICLLCGQTTHTYEFCDVYKGAKPITERCVNSPCRMWHPVGPCKFQEGLDKAKEKLARTKARQAKDSQQ